MREDYQIITKEECDDLYYESVFHDYYITVVENLKELFKTMIDLHEFNNSRTYYY